MYPLSHPFGETEEITRSNGTLAPSAKDKIQKKNRNNMPLPAGEGNAGTGVEPDGRSVLLTV
jgi:hypothetical protein